MPDKFQRRVVAEKLQTINAIHAHNLHELYRCFTVHGSGLTEKEMMYLKKRHSHLSKLMHDLNTIRERCNKSSA